MERFVVTTASKSKENVVMIAEEPLKDSCRNLDCFTRLVWKHVVKNATHIDKGRLRTRTSLTPIVLATRKMESLHGV